MLVPITCIKNTDVLSAISAECCDVASDHVGNCVPEPELMSFNVTGLSFGSVCCSISVPLGGLFVATTVVVVVVSVFVSSIGPVATSVVVTLSVSIASTSTAISAVVAIVVVIAMTIVTVASSSSTTIITIVVPGLPLSGIVR